MIRKHKTKIIAGFIVIVSFTFAFFQGEESSEDKIQYEEKIEESIQGEEIPIISYEEEETEIQKPIEAEIAIAEMKETAEVPEEDTTKELSCTLSVKCDAILNNTEMLIPEKRDIVPQDGVIFAEQTVVFYEDESVFNLLVREMKKNKIHLEFVDTPIYNSAYIEGIANLYEKDCGKNSGWLYMVNGQSPNYGCSNYKLKEGDKVEWVYYCR